MRLLRNFAILALMVLAPISAAFGQAEVVASCSAASAPLGSTGAQLRITQAGDLCINNAGSTVVAVGNVASGVLDAGNPVKVGAVFNTTPPGPLTTAFRVDLQAGSRGSLRTENFLPSSASPVSSAAAGADTFSNTLNAYYGFSLNSALNPAGSWDRLRAGMTADGVATTGLQAIEPMQFNGATWDRAFSCPNTAVINVTAAATTEIVPLTGGQTIRVCSFGFAMSAAGTTQFVNGTGTNCGTGTANVSGAIPLATGTPLAMGDGTAAVFRTPVSNALCVAAVTGNAVGFLTWAKY